MVHHMGYYEWGMLCLVGGGFTDAMRSVLCDQIQGVFCKEGRTCMGGRCWLEMCTGCACGYVDVFGGEGRAQVGPEGVTAIAAVICSVQALHVSRCHVFLGRCLG